MSEKRYDWSAVDWGLTSTDIASQLGCTVSAVIGQRERRGLGPSTNPASRGGKGRRRVSYGQRKTHALFVCDFCFSSAIFAALNTYHSRAGLGFALLNVCSGFSAHSATRMSAGSGRARGSVIGTGRSSGTENRTQHTEWP